ncbi:hypothetical protein C440_06597 [Haloferax mucosum ATCC BAA-1512]|uniref:DUF8186 domain-containing protein n=1 Tax=Haloferax mucosum ATCC BAA-1512 TaxID=662479 RepID=M0IJ96_9EURY|nr:hypothetical protein [Haloferax mucosum]ELZ95938.1 hypothetical protein C440_06597 [Haloferax mucosum ATCC BAA-1512]
MLLCTPAIVSASGVLSDEQARIFHSDDQEQNPASISGDVESGTAYAKVSDITYRTTKPQYKIDGTSLYEYQRDSLDRLSTDERSSRTLPSSETKDSGVIRDAHVTLLGVHGGAQPRLGTNGHSQQSDYPLLIGSRGKVLNYADYRISPSMPPENHCTDPDWEYSHRDIDGDNETERVRRDGFKTCYRYELHHKVDRWVTIEGERFDEGGDTISYRGLSSNDKQTLTVHAEITVRIARTAIEKDWDDIGGWDVFDVDRDRNHRFEQTEVTDSTEVLVTDAGSLDVQQTVIEVDNETKHLVLTLDGPHGPDGVNRNQLLNRRLWSYLALGDDQYVTGTWGTYSVRQYHRTTKHTNDDRDVDHDPPHVPRTYLVGVDRNPTVTSTEYSTTEASVIGFEGYNVKTSQIPQKHVSIEPKQPVAYRRIVISNAPKTVTSMVTIHGQEIDVDVTNRIQYRQPEIAIEHVHGKRVRIHVEDPKTGEPLTGRRVYLYGGTPESTSADGYAVTNENGDLYASRTGPFIRARTERDDWRTTAGDVFYDKHTASKTYLPEVILLERTYDLVSTVALVSPLIFLYFYIRHFGFFE